MMIDLGAFLMLVVTAFASGVTAPDSGTRCVDAIQQLVVEKLEIQSIDHNGDTMTFVMASKSAKSSRVAIVTCREQGQK